MWKRADPQRLGTLRGTGAVLDVYLFETLVGVLSARGRGVRFRYAAAALEDGALPDVSLALPKREEPYPDSRAGPFFRNLLPEQAFRRLVAVAAGALPEDSIALLGAIGGECPGAVSIWPSGVRPPAAPAYRDLGSADLVGLFARHDRAAIASALARGRLSLPGVQEKIALLRRANGSWAQPVNGAVTSHILKQPAAAFAGLLENELFCLALARAAGLEVARTALAAPEVRVLCIERFDRVVTGEGAGAPRHKLHQEDFCQLLAVEPERKYEIDGGPSLKRCAAIIRRHCALPAQDLERLVRWVGFNYLIGNEDAHAKNLALLYGDDGLRLSPHYDLVSTAVYAELERRMAMKIGGATDVRNVQRGDWERLARAVALPWPRVRAWLLEVLEAVRGVVPNVQQECAASSECAVYGEVAAVVERQGDRLGRELGVASRSA